MNDFENRNILIAGASSGIGLDLATQLKEKGANVFTTSRHESDELKKLNTKFMQWDVQSGDYNGEIPEELHGLVYCPGTINLKPFQALKEDDFRKDWEINFLGAVRLLKAAMKSLKKSGSGSVILFSTVASTVGINYHASISSAKAALEGLGKSLAAEWAKQHIRVNIISPSLTDTPLASGLLNSDEKRSASEKRHPLGTVGKPNDISSITSFLLSENAGWITGQNIAVDGGLSATRPI